MPILDKFSLKGRVALVTAGAGPQFGSSLSTGLAEAGATVITASRSLAANEKFAESLRAKGYDAHGMEFALGDPASTCRLHDEIIGRFGRLDVLVNSALLRDGYGGSFEEKTPELWI
jgi:NAD(P)-dependent dehydrogenase (short-subunit alcohol dehydrogenase family)